MDTHQLGGGMATGTTRLRYVSDALASSLADVAKADTLR
jgi:hypothetical protein